MSSDAVKVFTKDLPKVCGKDNNMIFQRKYELIEIHKKLFMSIAAGEKLTDEAEKIFFEWLA